MQYFAERFSHALRNGGVALLAGFATEQLPVEYREHPRIACWDSDSPQLNGTRISLPPRVRVVVLARFMSHATADQLSRAAKRSSALYFGKVAGTGEIARILREALPVGSQEVPIGSLPPAPLTAAATRPASPPAALPSPPIPEKFETLAAAIRFFAHDELTRPLPPGLTKSGPRPDAFWDGLRAQLQANGFPDVTHSQVRGNFQNARIGLLRDVARTEPPPPAVEQPAEVPPDVVAALPVPVPVTPLPPDLDALVTMADSLDLRALQATDLADQLRRLVVEQTALRATQAKYDALVSLIHAGHP